MFWQIANSILSTEVLPRITIVDILAIAYGIYAYCVSSRNVNRNHVTDTVVTAITYTVSQFYYYNVRHRVAQAVLVGAVTQHIAIPLVIFAYKCVRNALLTAYRHVHDAVYIAARQKTQD